MSPVLAQSIEEHIRRVVADAIKAGQMLDVQEAADLIARAHGCLSFVGPIATDLAEAAVAAHVPVKLFRGVQT
jgi:hypothetical protein